MLDRFWAAYPLADWVLENCPADAKIRPTLKTELIPRWINHLAVEVDRFDRCPEMVSHGSFHIANLLALAADVFDPVGRSRPCPLNGAERLALFAGIFLHDIGMATLEGEEARKRHGEESARILMDRKRKAAQTRVVSGKPDPGEACGWEDLLPGFNFRETQLVGVVCEYHQKVYPLDHAYLKKLKQPPIEITLESKLEAFSPPFFLDGEQVNVMRVAALLKFLDACDVQYSRVGSLWLARLKNETNRRLIEESENRELRLEPWRHAAAEAGLACHKDIEAEIRKERALRPYLRGQADKHYLKHLGIEKVWFLGEHLVAKPADVERFQKRAFALERDPDPGESLDALAKDLDQEYELVRERLAGLLEFKGVRAYDRKEHRPAIVRLPHYLAEFAARAPRVPKAWAGRAAFEEELTERLLRPGEKNVIAVIGPPVCGKSAAFLGVLKAIRQRHPGALDAADLFYLDLPKGLSLRQIILSLTKFLVMEGEVLFYNKLLMEQEIQECQWNLLFDQLDESANVICFDSCNHLPLRDRNSAEFRFFRRLLGMQRARIVLLGTVLPAVVEEDLMSRVVKMPVPPFSAPERAAAAGQPGLWGDFQGREGKAFDAEVCKAAAALLDEFPMFPCAFKAVRSEIELRRSMGKTIDKNEILGAIRSAREETRRVARKELFLRLGSDAERALIRHLKDVASPFAFDAAAIAARTGLDAKEAEEAAKELQRRHLLRPAGEGQYEIDSWWKAVLSET